MPIDEHRDEIVRTIRECLGTRPDRAAGSRRIELARNEPCGSCGEIRRGTRGEASARGFAGEDGNFACQIPDAAPAAEA